MEWPKTKNMISILQRLSCLVKERKQELQTYRKYQKYNATTITTLSHMQWIERLLQTPIEEYRENLVALVFAPYLVNIIQLSHQEAYYIIKDWSDRFSKLRKLDFVYIARTKDTLNTALRKHTLPMKLNTLEEKNIILYKMIKPVSK